MTPPADLTGAIVETARRLRLDDLPPEALEMIRLAILDCLACTVAGSRTDVGRKAAQWATGLGGHGEATIVGTDLRAPAPLAAFANAVAGHALDYDDVSLNMTHPSVSLVPVLLATAEARGLDGRAVIEAYAAGFEVEARICRALNPEHYERGWHTTGTIGVLGAAVSAARLGGLDDEATRWALGMAASSATGIRKNFGTMVKPLHAGQSVWHGMQAVGLAGIGFTASPSIMEGRNGYLHVFARPEAGDLLTEAFRPGAPLELTTSGIGLKRFACCGALHTAQDAILDMLATEGFTAADVVAMECRVNPLAPHILIHHVTQDGLEGKFSVEYSLAVCLLDGRAGLGQYTDERAADPELLRLQEATTVVTDPELPVNLAFFPTVVTVRLRDGREVRRRVDAPRGYPHEPLSRAEVADKALDCCAGTLTEQATHDLTDRVLSLEKCDDVSEIARLLRP
jgi:2-methylcitrate dehydratase PrpD